MVNFHIRENIEKFKIKRNLKKCTTSDIDKFSLDGRIYQCRVADIYDADTITVLISMKGELVKYSVRIWGIDAPEMKPKNSESEEAKQAEKKAAKRSRNRLMQLLLNDESIKLDTDYKRSEIRDICQSTSKIHMLECMEFDKYGRLLGKIKVKNNNIKEYAHDILVRENFAYSYFGKTKEKIKY